MDFWISKWISANSVQNFFRDGPLSNECGCVSVRELFEGGVNFLQLKRVLVCSHAVLIQGREEIKEIQYTNILVSSITFLILILIPILGSAFGWLLNMIA